MSGHFLVDEYKEIGNNLRHYGNMRFAQLTLFLVATGALLKLKYECISTVTSPSCKGLFVAGVTIITLAFWLLEERAADNWWDFYKRGKDIEPQLGFAQYTNRRSRKVLSASNAVRGIFLVVLLHWLWPIICFLL